MQKYIGKPQTIKKINLDIVYREIKASSGISQPEIAKKTGLSLQTVNKAVSELENANIIICSGTNKYTGGRRAKAYEVNQDREYIACVYIQDDQFYCKVTNVIEKTLKSCCYQRDKKLSWTDNLLLCIDALTRSVDASKIVAIGIAVPGTVTSDKIFNIPAIPEWEGINLKAIVAEHYRCSIFIENDIKSATMGAYKEYMSASDKNMVYLSVLNNIGSATIINRNLYNSSKCFAGEIAYMALDNQGKTEDHFGCADRILKHALENKNKEEIINLIAKLIVNICCVLDPDVIVLTTPHLSTADMGRITEFISKYVQHKYIPTIIIDKVISEKNLNGIITICRDKMEASIQIVKI